MRQADPLTASTTSNGSQVSLAASHFSLHPDRTARPLPFFHPTRAEFQRHGDPEASAPDLVSRWSSRASRKNRYAPRNIHVRKQDAERGTSEKGLPRKLSLIQVDQRLRHPHARFKVHLTWDVSFWVAMTFVFGSSAWIANGFILYLPLSPTPIANHTSAAAAMAFVGGTLFEIGSYLMYVESLNTGHEQLFGEELLGLLRGAKPADGTATTSLEDKEKLAPQIDGRSRKFRWIGFGSFRELGFLASWIQLWAASVFWISTLTGLPGIIPNLSTGPPTAIADIFFWTPQVIGGTGFIISSLLLMIEVQRRWWLPNLRSLGWHVAIWNLVGAIGFTACGACGYAAIASTKANYQSVMSTFWGSFAFMIGSCVQLWEALWREDPSADDSS